jgi:23S rRNA pseudouridine1911/1915/1917 synthase
MANARYTAGRDDAGRRLDQYLAAPERLGSRSKAAAALERGKIFLNNREVTPASAAERLSPGDEIRVWMDRPGSARPRIALGTDRDLPILHEDDAIVVLNKPAGVLAVPLARPEDGRSVLDDLAQYLKRRRRPRPLVVHRIDRDTSGLVLFAKTAAAQQHLKDQFKRRQPERVYQAVVYGHPHPASGTWRDRLTWDAKALIQKQTAPHDPRGREAASHYRLVERFRDASLIEVSLVTGRQNQIRIQARLHGHPLIGERRYVGEREPDRTLDFKRQALHASRLVFRHPDDDREMRFEAPLPNDMAALIARLRAGRPTRR